MTTTGQETFFESDGKSVEVDLTATVVVNQVAYVEGFLGITARAGDSGDRVALMMDMREYQFTVPSALSVAKGDTVYVDTTTLTGHSTGSSSYSTTAGSNKIALFKATMAKDSNNMVTGILKGG